MMTKLSDEEIDKIINSSSKNVLENVGWAVIGYSNLIGLNLPVRKDDETLVSEKTMELMRISLNYDKTLSELIKSNNDNAIQIYSLNEWILRKCNPIEYHILHGMEYCGWKLSSIDSSSYATLYSFEPKYTKFVNDLDKWKDCEDLIINIEGMPVEEILKLCTKDKYNK